MELPVEQIVPLTSNGKVIGFEYPHEDHFHTILISNDEMEKPEHHLEEEKELKAHVRKLYGLLKGTPVSIKNGLVTFAIPHPHQPYDPAIDYYSDEPDPRFDAGHVHPYAVALDRIEIPKKTGNPELDYENELLAFSKLSGIPVSRVKVEQDKFFVLPGHDHDHYINILNAEKGLKAYKENSLPEIKPHLAVGDFSKETVEAELDRIQELAKATFDPESLDYRRVLRVLDQQRSDIDSGSRSSTQAYLEALKDFEKRHILKETPDVSSEMAENPLEERYNQLSDQIKKLGDKTLKSYGSESSTLIERLKSATISENLTDMDQIDHYLKAIARTEAAPNDHLPRVAYMDYFLRHVDSEFLPTDLRETVAEKILVLRKDERNQTFRTQLEELVNLKNQVKQAIEQAQKQPVELKSSYEDVNRAKYDLVGHVNHWANIFHYAITNEEKADGLDRNLQVIPAIQPETTPNEHQPVTTEEIPETPQTDKEDTPKTPDNPSIPSPNDTEKENDSQTPPSTEERQAKLTSWLNKQTSEVIRDYNIDQKIWLEALNQKDEAILDRYHSYSSAIDRIESQKNDIGARTAHIDYFLRHIEGDYLDHPLRQSVANKLIQIHTGDSWDYKKSLAETVDLKNKVKSAQMAAKTYELLDSPAYQQYMTEKEDLVSWVNLRRDHFIKRHLITEEELKEGFDQEIVYEVAKTPAKPAEASLSEKDLEQPVEESGKSEETVPVEPVENKDTQPDELIENRHHLEETVPDTDDSETRAEISEDKQDEAEGEGI
ncbi:hypothetical protein [Streptococcus ovuberis]|uniref:Histidine triad protein n=1 Tax=Streptococcus ovuberis TaxID=1936207 RepID=A0A7X6MVX8_9STRE|nr:hypothetical protein [Streptococcus ovuberis]NKZ19360.1 hypothetical protein [Streptococcus ovuberis]